MTDLDLLLTVAQKHTALKLIGNKYVGLCPIHSEKTPSFYIYTEKAKWRCFGGCGGGDAIDLHRAMTGVNYIQAKKDLGLWDDSRPQPNPRPPKPPTAYESDDRAECYKVARYTLTHHLDCTITHDGTQYRNHQFIFQCLFDNPDPLPYLNKILEEIQTNPEPSPGGIIDVRAWFAECFINDARRLFAVERAEETTS
jgi:hypothetical protein